MKQVSLKEFITFLDRLDPKMFREEAVGQYLAAHLVTREDFTPFIYFRDDTYGRNLVAKSPHYELLVLTWLPKQRTSIHDHNGQRCWMLVHAGALTFKCYSNPGASGKLSPIGSVETKKSGDSNYIDDTLGFHSIANANATVPAISVHLYAGPVPRCQTYNESTKRLEWTELQYFTQLGEMGREMESILGT